MNDEPVDLTAAILHPDSLPTMPVIARKILRLPLDSDSDAQLLRPIVQNSDIPVRIIGLANCPLFDPARAEEPRPTVQTEPTRHIAAAFQPHHQPGVYRYEYTH